MFDNITLEGLPNEQKELAECIGIEKYRLLVKCYGGSSIYIPQAKSLMKSERNTLIQSDYNGKNIRELSRKYNLSVSAIRKILDNIM